MSLAVTCECGHVTELADREPYDVAGQTCSACGRALSLPTQSGKRVFQQLWQSHVSDEVVVSEPSSPVESHEPRRSLWDVMRGSATPTSELLAPVAPTADEPASKPKSLWGVMHSTRPAEAGVEPDGLNSSLLPPGEGGRRPDEGSFDHRLAMPNAAATTESASTEVARPIGLHPDSLPRGEGDRTAQLSTPISNEQKFAQAASLASMGHVASTWRPEPVPEPWDESEREWSKRSLIGFTFAVLTVVAAVASFQPEWWWRGPALAFGLVAVLLGFIAAGETRRSRGALKGVWLARSSVLLGVLGMFLAPLVFARLGERHRENAGQAEISWRLRRIGEGLNQFHAQRGHFPEASLKGRDAHGDDVPMHGWMTSLLPMLGHDAVYRQINLKQPFDAPTNVAAMQQQIPEFTLPSRKPLRTQRGFSVTHFAGVGGQDVREPAGLVGLGMFSDRGPIKRADITDGLSQTLVVGEIRDRDPPAPPWGEPGNVRSIGEGLNRQFRGFGNANGSGATFLHADGSVKFYSTKTDRRVLEQLETRDGGER